MKKILLISGLITAVVLGYTSISNAADLGGYNNMQNMQQMQQMQQMQNPFYDMQQLQNERRAKKNSINEFQSFEAQKKARQEMIKKENERQQYLDKFWGNTIQVGTDVCLNILARLDLLDK